MKQVQKIPETFLGVGYARDRAGLPLEPVRVPVPQPAVGQFSSASPPRRSTHWSTSWPTSISWDGHPQSFSVLTSLAWWSPWVMM
jgi:hypothetical protein